jgi:DNA mismatch repair protein MutL
VARIQRLSADLANQIAAGEVVERPASVVKELVENAVDAGARRIAITVEMGGKRLIRVEDDGEGMGAEDARLAIERHATSKIREAGDLGRIATLGFRGEALPSIASVSHFVLRSRARGTPSGTEIRVDGGAVAPAREVGMPEGTSVEVADLFYNLPARRKFLKSDAAEAGQISRVTTQLALCYPEVGFTLTSAGRKVLQCPPVASLADRLFQILGERPDLVEVRRESGDLRLTGYAAALAEQGPTRGAQNLFVNRRVVKDRTIAHAILDAYSLASIKERSPEVHLFIEMPYDALDVNVHPTKAEVRFRDQSYVHQFVRRAVADALGQGPAPALQLQPPQVELPPASTLPLPHAYTSAFPSRWQTPMGGPPASGGAGYAREALDALGLTASTPDVSAAEAASPSAVRPMMALGQFRDTFIIAVDEEGIAIIDQHVAHERVLYERISERLTTSRLESQRMLEPLLVELPPGSRQALAAHAGDLERLGFELEEFGGDAVRVSAHPSLLRRDDCAATIRALADDLEGFDRGSPAESALKQIAATMACHAAVKAHYPLTPEKMAHILEELHRTAYSTICPHGRPVMLRLTRRDLEKSFQRI